MDGAEAVNPGGLVIAVAGVWLGCQIFGGQMLDRLRITKETVQVQGTGSHATGAAAGSGGGKVLNA